MFSCHVEPKTPSINGSYFNFFMPLVHVYLKWIFFLSQNFVPSCIGLLEKFWFTEFAGLPKADTFHYTIFKRKNHAC